MAKVQMNVPDLAVGGGMLIVVGGRAGEPWSFVTPEGEQLEGVAIDFLGGSVSVQCEDPTQLSFISKDQPVLFQMRGRLAKGVIKGGKGVFLASNGEPLSATNRK